MYMGICLCCQGLGIAVGVCNGFEGSCQMNQISTQKKIQLKHKKTDDLLSRIHTGHYEASTCGPKDDTENMVPNSDSY